MKIAAIATAAVVLILGMLTISYHILKEKAKSAALRKFSSINEPNTWRLWNEGDASELIDALRDESCNPSEVLRCIHISLLCVQQHPDDRPSMASVVWMLGGDSALPNPKEPAFLNDRGPLESSSSSNKVGLSSTNEITVSVLEPR
ncbi:G-type lectin S-receptor-like serine/threonine-protein kinase [Populus alba x Populus x berolinensis]|nr:G-type lectin S-receptor-like serine/threonine-protein kinase [Populus alba x Populus x berolinensis]